LDHKTFIASLPRSTIAQLVTIRDTPGLVHLAGHVAVIVFLSIWITQGWWAWPLALLGQGIALCFLFTLEHEATHKTPFRTQWINEWAGRACGLVLIQPFEWFRYFHLAHHRHTNIPGKDPELIAGAKPETRTAYIWHVSGLPFWAAMTLQILKNALGRDLGAYVPDRAHPRVITEARVMMGLYVVAALSLLVSPVLFWIWLLPCLLGQPFLRFYLLAEHGRCAFVANMLENTRTTLTNRVVRFFAWNMPYHIEHHCMPQVR
jgi:fatty acid desaturase